MDQAHWDRLSDVRIAEAQALISAGLWAGAYYLAGYAVECKLKALVVKKVDNESGIIFREQRFQSDVWTHNFADLLKSLGLLEKLKQDKKKNSRLENYWNIASNWDEATRFGFPDETQARNLVEAVLDPTDEVLSWISENS